VIYFDTSYLVRLYYQDADWEKVRRLAAQDNVACAWHGQAELLAAFHRKLRDKDILPAHYMALIDQFAADDRGGAFHWLPLAQETLARVSGVYRSLPGGVFLRGADALHLAAAACQGFKVIYSHDKHLLSAATHFGLEGRDIVTRTGET
jgi:predicted nucleic acid-binding protein